MQNPHPMVQSMNHHGRSRRNQRMSSQQPGHRQYRQHQKHVEKIAVLEPPSITAFRARFEAGRSFDLDDDMEFCPNLLTWDERQSVTSGSSDRSSLSSGSPENSPLQQQLQPQLNPALVAAVAPATYVSPPTNFASQNLKLHQPSAIRSRNPIPIVNPDTRVRMSPTSVSPNMMQQANAHRHW